MKHLGLENEKQPRLVREEVEAWFADRTLDIHFYKTDDFTFLEEGEDRESEEHTMHTEKRRKTLVLESALLSLLGESNDLVVMNKSAVSFKDFGGGNEAAKAILKELREFGLTR